MSSRPKLRPASRTTPIRCRGQFRLPSRAIFFDHTIYWLTSATLCASLVLGGATRSGALGDVFLQFLCAFVLIAALREIVLRQALGQFKWPLLFIAAAVLIPVLQLVPMPLDLWKHLPGRSVIAETYILIERDQPPSPLTLTPTATWLSGLSLLPPIAVFLGVLTLSNVERRYLSLLVIAMAVASVFLGLLQLIQGPHSALRFYDITNRTEAVGFFANRNHLAALLYVSALLIGVHLLETLAVARTVHSKRIDANSLALLIGWLTALVIVMAGAMMARSRAGLLLMFIALLGSVSLARADMRLKMLRPGITSAVIGTAIAIPAFLSPLALYRILERFGADSADNLRIPFARNTISAAMAYMPWGSGLGSFVPVYQLFEPTPEMGLTYANHAHNDLLEVWLETGVVGLILVAIVCSWLFRRSLALWNDKAKSGIDLPLRRAAAIALALLLAHSLVDYPLRTTAIATVSAMLAAFLFWPLPDTGWKPRFTAETVSSHKRVACPPPRINVEITL
ncbi:O-antigen polymerase [Hyphomicrobium sp. MC1]|nr:O-antigen polymerase [Hyphomicrobium sp. MC1]